MQFAAALEVLMLLVVAIVIPKPTVYANTGDWPTLMEGIARSGYNASETIINPTTASNLKLHWSYTLGFGKDVSSQPVEANGLSYWGAWDGYERATDQNGRVIWQTYLGQTTDSNCDPPSVGVASTATVATVPINGTMTPVVFVGGGNGNFYTLNANTGAIIWQTLLGSPPSHFLWSSPALYHGSIYEGVSSFGDCPLVQGQLVQLKASTGAIQHIFNVVPTGCIGGSVWGSPAIDGTTGTIYFGTGNAGSCSTSEKMAPALVALKTTDLSFVGSWQVPASQQIIDSDFGTTPTLFKAMIGGVLRAMVGIENKNGIYYAFDRTNISAGPVWRDRLATGKGTYGLSSSAWDGARLYAAGASTIINGTSCPGSLRALNTATGQVLWQICLNHNIYTPITSVRGVVVVGDGPSLIAVNATTGKQLFSYQDSVSSSHFAGTSISNGVLYAGNLDGKLYAFGM